MNRELHVAPAVAAALPAAHIAQLTSDAGNDDNVCVACGALITGPAADLVVLHDARTVLARMAHPGCVRSGVYAWDGTTHAVQQLTLRPDGLDVATLLAWRRAPRPRALVMIEPRVQISLDGGEDDSLERLFARPLGLVPVASPIDALAPPGAAGTLRRRRFGLELVTDGLRVSLPARPELCDTWSAHADGDRAVVIVGRGLGINGPEHLLLRTVNDALRTRPVWAATFAVTRSS